MWGYHPPRTAEAMCYPQKRQPEDDAYPPKEKLELQGEQRNGAQSLIKPFLKLPSPELQLNQLKNAPYGLGPFELGSLFLATHCWCLN